jgi:hypothetical protein
MNCSVTDLGSRRRTHNVLSTITVVLGGVNYGTLSVNAIYEAGKPLVLYAVPAGAGRGGDQTAMPVDCLLTDEAGLGADAETVAR